MVRDPQQALKDLLLSQEVQRLFPLPQETQGPPEIQQAVEKGDIPALCQYLSKNPSARIPEPVQCLMERLRYLFQNIGSDFVNVSWCTL